MRGWIISVLFVLLITAGLSGQTKSRSVKDLFEGAPPPAAADPVDDDPAAPPATVAEVNRLPISQKEFYRVMYASAGARVLRQLIGLELAKQIAASDRVEPTKEDIDREFRTVVSQLGPSSDALGKTLSFEDRRRLLRGILQRRGISYDEFQLGIQQQAYLRAVAAKRVTLTDKLVQEEFDRTYGKRRVARAIVLQDMKVAQEVFDRLQKGESFPALAVKHSIDFETASIGGQLGQVAPGDPRFPAIISKTVFDLAIDKYSSPIKIDDQFWIIKAEQEVAPQPISLDEVRDKLTEQLRTRLENEMIVKIQAELFKNAKIRVRDKLLAKDFDRWLKEIQTQEK